MGCVCVYMEKVELRYWWEHSDKKNMNKLVEWKAFVDTYEIKSADLKNKLLFKSFATFQATFTPNLYPKQSKKN